MGEHWGLWLGQTRLTESERRQCGRRWTPKRNTLPLGAFLTAFPSLRDTCVPSEQPARAQRLSEVVSERYFAVDAILLGVLCGEETAPTGPWDWRCGPLCASEHAQAQGEPLWT